MILCRACMATMGILYYRLVQRGLGVELPDEEQQSIWVRLCCISGDSAFMETCWFLLLCVVLVLSLDMLLVFSETSKWIVGKFHFSADDGDKLHILGLPFPFFFLLFYFLNLYPCFLGLFLIELKVQGKYLFKLGCLVIIYLVIYMQDQCYIEFIELIVSNSFSFTKLEVMSL